MSKDVVDGTGSAAAKHNNWTFPAAAKTGTTETHQSSAFLGFTRGMSAASYIFNDGTQQAPLCSGPVRQCTEGNLYGGDEAASTWFQAALNVPGAAYAGLPPSAYEYNRGTRRAVLDETIGMNQWSAKSSLEAQGFTVTVVTVSGAGTPAGTVVSAVPSDPNLSRGSVITLNISDGAAAPASSTATGTWTGTATATPTPGASGASTEPTPTTPVDLREIGRQFGDMADGLAGLLN